MAQAARSKATRTKATTAQTKASKTAAALKAAKAAKAVAAAKARAKAKAKAKPAAKKRAATPSRAAKPKTPLRQAAKLAAAVVAAKAKPHSSAGHGNGTAKPEAAIDQPFVERHPEPPAFEDWNVDGEDLYGYGVDGFELLESGLWCHQAKDGHAQWVCQHFRIAGTTVDEHDENPGLLLRWKDRQGAKHQFAIPMPMIVSKSGLLMNQLMKRNFHIRDPKRCACLKEYLIGQEDNPALPTITVYDRCGWQNSGQTFVMPNGQVLGVADGRNAMFASPNRRVYGSSSTLHRWQDEVAPFGVGNSRLAFAISCAFAGPLIEMVDAGYLIFHFHGDSSIGKSTGGALAASVWGRPARGDQIRSWRTTENALEPTASETSDTLTTMDEFGEAPRNKLPNIIYMLANGSGRYRLKWDGGAAATRHFRACILSTGETTLETSMRAVGGTRQATAGMTIRMLNIAADAGKKLGVFDTLQDFSGNAGKYADHIKDVALQHYGTAGRAFIADLMSLRASDERALVEQIKAAQQTVVDLCPAGADGQVKRSASKFGLVAAAGELAISMGILPWPIGESQRAAARCFTEWLSARGSARSMEAIQCEQRVAEFLQQNAEKFYDATQIIPKKLRTTYPGWVDRDKTFHVYASVWAEIVAPLGARAAAVSLARSGHLIHNNKDPSGPEILCRTQHDPRTRGKVRVYSVLASLVGDVTIEGEPLDPIDEQQPR